MGYLLNFILPGLSILSFIDLSVILPTFITRICTSLIKLENKSNKSSEFNTSESLDLSYTESLSSNSFKNVLLESNNQIESKCWTKELINNWVSNIRMDDLLNQFYESGMKLKYIFGSTSPVYQIFCNDYYRSINIYWDKMRKIEWYSSILISEKDIQLYDSLLTQEINGLDEAINNIKNSITSIDNLTNNWNPIQESIISFFLLPFAFWSVIKKYIILNSFFQKSNIITYIKNYRFRIINIILIILIIILIICIITNDNLDLTQSFSIFFTFKVINKKNK